LDTVQRDKKIFGSVSITSWIKEHGGTYRGFVQFLTPVQRHELRQFKADTNWVSAVAFSPDGRTIISSSWDPDSIKDIFGTADYFALAILPAV
jgi:WD40 repeat protein